MVFYVFDFVDNDEKQNNEHHDDYDDRVVVDVYNSSQIFTPMWIIWYYFQRDDIVDIVL